MKGISSGRAKYYTLFLCNVSLIHITNSMFHHKFVTMYIQPLLNGVRVSFILDDHLDTEFLIGPEESSVVYRCSVRDVSCWVFPRYRTSSHLSTPSWKLHPACRHGNGHGAELPCHLAPLWVWQPGGARGHDL